MVFHPPVAIVAKAGDAGKYKVGLPAWNMVVRGFMSGAYIAMGGALATVCSTGIAYSAAQITAGAVPGGFASAGMAQLVLGAVFPVGLIITVLTGAELFTGDAMLAPMAAFIHKIELGTGHDPVGLCLYRQPDRLNLLGIPYGKRSLRNMGRSWRSHDNCVWYHGLLPLLVQR